MSDRPLAIGPQESRSESRERPGLVNRQRPLAEVNVQFGTPRAAARQESDPGWLRPAGRGVGSDRTRARSRTPAHSEFEGGVCEVGVSAALASAKTAGMKAWPRVPGRGGRDALVRPGPASGMAARSLLIPLGGRISECSGSSS
jgi:hypothetical protein